MMRCWSLALLVILLVGSVACASPPGIMVTPEPSALPPSPAEPLRLFWVNSYTSDDIGATQIQAGIRETLTRYGYVPGTTLVFDAYHLDVGRYDDIEMARVSVAEIVAAIQTFGPDIVVVSDDEAAQLVIPNYPDATMPFVFCGVTGDPESYDLLRPNVTGVLERPRPLETLAMAQAFVEPVTRYIILGDTSPTGGILAQYVYGALYDAEAEGPEPILRLVSRWSDWQSVVLEEAATVDFILLLNFDTVVDEDGNYMQERAMMMWMLENSPVPVFALSKQGVLNGAVGGLVTDGEQQGGAAAQLVVRIAGGAHPSTIAIEPSGHRLLMNLAAARHWNLRIPVMIPLAADVYSTLPATSQGGQQ